MGPARLRNELTYRGEARFVAAVAKTVPGLLRIVGDITIFRGDANDDGTIDLSDAVFVLGFLFRGSATPPCPDAADANDDGTIDISDPIAILTSLFVEGSSLAPPYPRIDVDPTTDSLGPCHGPSETP